MLAERAHPARGVAAGKAGENPPAREMIEHGDVLGELDWVDRGQVHAELPDAHRLGVLGDEVVPEQRVRGGFDALDLHVLFGHAEAAVTQAFGELHLLAQAVHQKLEPCGVGSRERHALASGGQVRDDEDGEFHGSLSVRPSVVGVRLAECLLDVQQFIDDTAVVASDARSSHSGRGWALGENGREIASLRSQ